MEETTSGGNDPARDAALPPDAAESLAKAAGLGAASGFLVDQMTKVDWAR
jgi:hypothetical protein